VATGRFRRNSKRSAIHLRIPCKGTKLKVRRDVPGKAETSCNVRVAAVIDIANCETNFVSTGALPEYFAVSQHSAVNGSGRMG
jgi:hypothetical protein